MQWGHNIFLPWLHAWLEANTTQIRPWVWQICMFLTAWPLIELWPYLLLPLDLSWEGCYYMHHLLKVPVCTLTKSPFRSALFYSCISTFYIPEMWCNGQMDHTLLHNPIPFHSPTTQNWVWHVSLKSFGVCIVQWNLSKGIFPKCVPVQWSCFTEVASACLQRPHNRLKCNTAKPA